MDYRAISICIYRDCITISLPAFAPSKFYEILVKQGFTSHPTNKQEWRAPLSTKDWVLTRLYPKLKDHGALVFDHSSTNAPVVAGSSDDDKATIARLVEEVESLKKLSAELNKRLNDLSHR
jgi:hypothetical protein